MTNAVTLASLANSGYLRNRIINGAMMIDQRNAGAAVTTNGAFPVDRWPFGFDAGAQSAQRSTIAPSGFTNSLGLTISTGASPTASQQSTIRQFIEGVNVADLGFGTASASTITVSFWVRSSVTGTYSGAIMNSAFNRSYVFNYVINSANTWEYKTVTIPGDTTGTWLTDTGVGIRLYFDTGCGSNYNTTANTWAAGTFFRTSGSVTLCATTGATFYITGVQLEVGTQATPFEWRPYGLELAMCQRYYFKNADARYSGYQLGSTDLNQIPFTLPVTMRATPTVTLNTGAYPSDNNSSLSVPNNQPQGFVISLNKSGGGYYFSRFEVIANIEL